MMKIKTYIYMHTAKFQINPLTQKYQKQVCTCETKKPSTAHAVTI